MRNLKWLGFRVPLAIVNKAHTANQIYPFAVSLIESVRMYERTCIKVLYFTSAHLARTPECNHTCVGAKCQVQWAVIVVPVSASCCHAGL